jgi:hypothetical protein
VDYASTVFPDECRVLGIRLETPRIGHALLLQRLGSPFAELDRKGLDQVRRGDLAEALIVLSRPWRRAERLLRSRRGVWLMWWYGLVLSSLAAQIEAFDGLKGYLLLAWGGPKTWVRPVASTQKRGECLSMLVSVLREKFGMPADTVYEMPICQGLWDVCLYLERAGLIEIIDSGDEDLLAKAEQMERDLKHGAKG